MADHRWTSALALLVTTALVAGCGEGLVSHDDVTALTSPQERSPDTRTVSRGNTFKGPAVRVGGGKAQAFVTLGHDGEPASLGVLFSEKALTRLPHAPQSWVLRFHPQKWAMPFTHVLLDYNPEGHEPPGVYDLEHFDVHFYVSSLEERLAIGPNDDAQFANAPPAQYLPVDYMQIPGGVPQMGAHWVDMRAPEFNGGIFSRTFIWGSYDGEVTFLEPMITMDYLRSTSAETIPIRQPDAFQRDGYYPASYRIERRERPGGYLITLEDLAFHTGE